MATLATTILGAVLADYLIRKQMKVIRVRQIMQSLSKCQRRERKKIGVSGIVAYIQMGLRGFSFGHCEIFLGCDEWLLTDLNVFYVLNR